jgi:hypothetical protein
MIARCEEQTRPKESERGLSHFVGNGREKWPRLSEQIYPER